MMSTGKATTTTDSSAKDDDSSKNEGCLFCSRSRRNTVNNFLEPKKEETDTLLAQALNQLSMEERNQVLHDLHGVVDLPEETPDFVSQLLSEFKDELNLIPNDDKQAFRLAESMSILYVHDPKFQLGFLRAEIYKAKQAAQRMVKYFDQKLKWFGKDKLTRPIGLDDLLPEDLDHFRKGFFQLSPERDQSGRLILCNKFYIVAKTPVDTRCRLTWYIYSVAAEDEQTQRKGAIFVSDAIGWNGFYTGGTSADFIYITQSLPIRLSAIHLCYDSPLIHPIIKLMVFVLDRNQQCRLRFHYGSRMECHYVLMTFGIPKPILPIEDDDNVRLANVEKFLSQRRDKEKVGTTPIVPNPLPKVGEGGSNFVVPTEMDVLMGRGKAKGQPANPGNRRYIQLLMDHYHLYETSSEKVLIIELVLQKVKEGNGRFLRQVKDMRWIEADDNLARKKIGHAFRNLRAPSASQVAALSSSPSPLSNSNRSNSSGSNADKNKTKSTSTSSANYTSDKKKIESSLKREMDEEVVGLRNDLGTMSQNAKKLRFSRH